MGENNRSEITNAREIALFLTAAASLGKLTANFCRARAARLSGEALGMLRGKGIFSPTAAIVLNFLFGISPSAVSHYCSGVATERDCRMAGGTKGSPPTLLLGFSGLPFGSS